VALVPGAAAGLRALATAGFGLAVITNQSGVGRGYFDEPTLGAIHDRMTKLLAADGVRLDGVYYCPHTPEDGCRCRKPGTLLVEQAARDLGFDPARSIIIGDNRSDVELGRRLGATTILVRTGHGGGLDLAVGPTPDHVVDDLGAAASLILRSAEAGRSPGV
jgi:D-glycero-D-manno-heptose 1,7-bisphosphate phosphatase